jgi:SET domain-containing protein
MTLETQYRQYMEKHEDCSFSFEEWKKEVFIPFIEDSVKQISELPSKYNYRPLPIALTIKNSKIEGLGLFSIPYLGIAKDENLGISHVKFENQLIRTPLGGFINHSSTPNCKITNLGQLDKPYYYIVTLREIEGGEELTVNYYDAACGNEALIQLK